MIIYTSGLHGAKNLAKWQCLSCAHSDQSYCSGTNCWVMIRYLLFITLPLFIVTGISSPGFGSQEIPAIHVTAPPVIDGEATDAVWQNVQEIKTYDKTADLTITLKAVYTDAEIFLLINFPDPDESRTHKSWIWDSGRELYTVGNDREDVFVIKWGITPGTTDLSINADNPYQADIWYWKACRTDGIGFADDKLHTYSEKENSDATKTVSRSGKTMYLLRTGDTGTSAYSTTLQSEYEGDILPRFRVNQPTGSRGDVRAKGRWDKGFWTIEFGRKFQTGNEDDVQFNTTQKFLFGVSRYEIAGRELASKLSNPLFGTGDVSESLWLKFMK